MIMLCIEYGNTSMIIQGIFAVYERSGKMKNLKVIYHFRFYDFTI
jgi:hypothetical protein